MMSTKRNSTFRFDENNIMKYFKTRLLHEETHKTETIWNDEYEEKSNCPYPRVHVPTHQLCPTRFTLCLSLVFNTIQSIQFNSFSFFALTMR